MLQNTIQGLVYNWDTEEFENEPEEDFIYYMDMERLIFKLEKEQTLILLYRYMGFKPEEIVEILGFKNIGKYYRLNFKLRRNYEKQIKLSV